MSSANAANYLERGRFTKINTKKLQNEIFFFFGNLIIIISRNIKFDIFSHCCIILLCIIKFPNNSIVDAINISFLMTFLILIYCMNNSVYYIDKYSFEYALF